MNTYPYSRELVSRYKKYLLEKKGIAVNEDEAQIHLASFVHLFSAFAVVEQGTEKKD